MAIECPPNDEFIPQNEYKVEDFIPTTKEHFDHMFKIMLLGDSGVGKTSIVTRFMKGDMHDNIATMTGGIEFKHVIFDVTDEGSDVKCAVKLQLWDSAGQPRFRELAKTHCRNKQAFLLFYDVTERTSFENIDMWMTELREVVKSPLVYLVANKCDCDADKRAVTMSEGKMLATKIGTLFFETSAQTGTGVALLFQTLAKSLINNMEKT